MRYSRGRVRETSGRLAFLCLSLLVALGSIALASAAWTDEITISGSLTTGSWDADGGGSPGFWMNWDKQDTYTKIEMEGFLLAIDESSVWLGPTTSGGMQGLFEAAFGAGTTHESRFLAHYLCTRLNLESGRMHASIAHDISSIDPDNYLNLLSPWSITIPEIATAIEAKHGTAVSKDQFAIMLNVCESLHHPS